MPLPRMKFLEKGFGIRMKIHSLKNILDQRRLDGTKTNRADTILKKSSDFLDRNFIAPGKKSESKGLPQQPYDFEKVMNQRKRTK